MYQPPGDPRVPVPPTSGSPTDYSTTSNNNTSNNNTTSSTTTTTTTAATAATTAPYSSSTASPVTSSRFPPNGPMQSTPQSLIGSMAPPSAYPPSSNAAAAAAAASGQWYSNQRLPPLPHLMPPSLDMRSQQQQQSAPPPPGSQQQASGNIITVYNISPLQGSEGTVITVTCDLNFPLHPGNAGTGNLIRMIIGGKDVDTGVQGPGGDNQYYIVTAEVPALADMKTHGPSVPIRMEALTERFGIAENVALGEFIITDNGVKRRRSVKDEASPITSNKSIPARTARQSSRREGYAPALPNSFVYDSPPPSPQPGLVRTTQMHGGAPVNNNPYVVRTKARLEIEGNLDNMKCGWTNQMWQNRRCLVQFTRRQVGATVHASFQSVEERDWKPNMIVISCLWHEARSECFFTSVDAIYLLECLMATRYTTEEKNRIRRNLESFKPTTLQKNEGQWQDFYAHIMSYPNPKPRNIDKGLKVFPWGHLEQALKKIFGNYSAYITVPFQYGGSADSAQPVTYGHQTHAQSDALSYTEDRAAAHHAAAAAAGRSNSDLSFVDMGSASGDSREFSSYVNISPATTPYPRDPMYPFSDASYGFPQMARQYDHRSTSGPAGGPPSSSPNTQTQSQTQAHASQSQSQTEYSAQSYPPA